MADPLFVGSLCPDEIVRHRHQVVGAHVERDGFLAAGRPEAGQAGGRCEGVLLPPDERAEFATSINNDTGGEFP